MPKNRPAATNGRNGGFKISYAALGGIIGILTIAGAVWKVGSTIATKDDVLSIKQAITPILDKHEDRIRALEIQVARFFGPSQTSGPTISGPVNRPSSDESPMLSAFKMRFVSEVSRAVSDGEQSAQQKAENLPPRRVVVPEQVIKMYDLMPSRGGTYSLLGEDGKLYSIDDVLAVMIRLDLQELRAEQPDPPVVRKKKK